MIQFYLLSVLLNALAGYLLLFGGSGGVLEFKAGFSLKDETLRLVVGIASAVTGLFKLLSPVAGNVTLVGDIVPAAAGLLCGFALIFESYHNRNSTDGDDTDDSAQAPRKIDRALVANKRIIGAAAIIASVLHFVFPMVLLL